MLLGRETATGMCYYLVLGSSLADLSVTASPPEVNRNSQHFVEGSASTLQTGKRARRQVTESDVERHVLLINLLTTADYTGCTILRVETFFFIYFFMKFCRYLRPWWHMVEMLSNPTVRTAPLRIPRGWFGSIRANNPTETCAGRRNNPVTLPGHSALLAGY